MKNRKNLLPKILLNMLIITYFFLLIFSERSVIEQINVNLTHSNAPAEFLRDDNIVSGQFKSCEWLIDKDGVLVIWPQGSYGYLYLDTGENMRSWPWHHVGNNTNKVNYYDIVKKVRFEPNVRLKNNVSGMFNELENLESIDFNNLDTSQATNMGSMFRKCSKLSELDLSSWDTSRVENMQSMFLNAGIVKLNIGGSFDTKNVENMDSMFHGIEKTLNTITLGQKTNLKTDKQEVGNGGFGRGTWERYGTKYSVPEICDLSTSGNAEGTYVKKSNISKEFDIKRDFNVKYRIGEIHGISECTITGRSPDDGKLFRSGDGVYLNVNLRSSNNLSRNNYSTF